MTGCPLLDATLARPIFPGNRFFCRILGNKTDEQSR